MSNYMRVLPRDLFNEAKLLKCLGKLTLMIEDRMAGKLLYVHDERRFKINQNESGDIYCVNIEFFILDQPISMYCPLNSRSPWPLFALYLKVFSKFDEDKMYTVFDDEGNLTEEFKALIELDPVANFGNPVEWQRKEREDRKID